MTFIRENQQTASKSRFLTTWHAKKMSKCKKDNKLFSNYATGTGRRDILSETP